MGSEKTVGDYVTLIRGITYKGNLVGEPGPALLGLGSIHPGGGFREGDYKTYGGECPPKLMLVPGDLFVSLKGATKDGKMIGSVARVPASVPSGRLTQDTVKLEFQKRDKETADFLYWVLRTPQYRDYCAGRATGSAVVALSRDDFLTYPVPELTNTRKRLVQTFEALSDKIELNQRMNETLEALAQSQFKSWFVDATQSALPKGWRKGRLDEVLVLQRGFDLPSTARTPGPHPVLCASGPNGTHGEFMVRGPGVTTGRSGALGQVYYVHEDFWPHNTSLWVKEFKHSTPLYAFHLLRGLDFGTFNSGSAVPTLNRNHVHNLPVNIPPIELIQKFEATVSPLYLRLKSNDEESRTLAALRDALLPNLLSGELRVPGAKKQERIL